MSTQNATAIMTSAPLPPTVRHAVRYGLPTALIAAAVLSFQGLYTLACAVGWAAQLAWLLPVSIDVAAAIATVVWLGSPADHGATRSQAARTALFAIALSVLGNAAAHLIEAHVIEVTPTVIVIVTSIPPVVVALLVHLGMSLPHPGSAPELHMADAPSPETTAVLRRTIADAVQIATAMLEAERQAGRDPDRLTSTPLAARLGCTSSYARRILRIARSAEPVLRRSVPAAA